MPVHVIPDEGESVSPNKKLEKSSKFMYHKKDANVDASLYNMLLNSLKKLDTPYKPTMTKMHYPVIRCNYKVTGYTRVIPIVEHEDEKSSGRAVRSFLRTLESLKPSRKR